MNELSLVKKLNETYLYNVTDTYRIQMTKAIIESERIDKTDEAFASIKYEVNSRQTNYVTTKVLLNPDVVLIRPNIPLPRALKVFTAKDIKNQSKYSKVFIDVSEILMIDKDGNYKTNSIDKLIAYLTSAMVQLIYNIEPLRLINNTVMIEHMRNAFCQMVTYIIDYLYKISNTDITKEMCKHVSSMYFDTNILRLDPNSDPVRAHALKISKLSEREIDVLEVYIDETSFTNIKSFIETMAKVLKINKLTLDVFLAKWIYIYGSGTQFGLELYTAFSDILTNAYCIAYINNQKTIEKVVGNDMSQYSIKVISLGGGLM